MMINCIICGGSILNAGDYEVCGDCGMTYQGVTVNENTVDNGIEIVYSETYEKLRDRYWNPKTLEDVIETRRCV